MKITIEVERSETVERALALLLMSQAESATSEAGTWVKVRDLQPGDRFRDSARPHMIWMKTEDGGRGFNAARSDGSLLSIDPERRVQRMDAG